ncbi:MAG: VCBS repeat-containing protein, partial [Planctomycetes bacterium]|nr:VCBS repeat-containing protein [Planctomycetota bacterium]
MSQSKSDLIGGGRTNDPSADVSSSERPALGPGHEQRLISRPLQHETSRFDPSVDGWRSETFEQAASAQLKKLGKLLVHPQQLDADSLSSVADDSFRCGRLRPAVVEVYRDRTIVVSRPDTDAISKEDSDRSATTQGPGRLAHALIQLIEPLRDTDRARVTTKVVSVDSDGERFTTRILYQASGQVGNVMVQQNAIWTCGWSTETDETPKLLSIEQADYEQVETLASQGTLFSDCTESVFEGCETYREHVVWGVDHWRSRTERTLAPFVLSLVGMAVGDANGDGWDDVYLCQGNGLPNRLLLQQTDGTVRDASREAGVDWLDTSTSALFVDLDNDGDQDLVVGGDQFVLVHFNQGRGKFAPAVRLPFHTVVTSLTAADFDGDRRIDIYVCAHTPNTAQQRESVIGLPIPYQDANNGARNVLFRNEGGGRFSDVTDQVGLEENNTRFSYAASWEDYDNDGDLDLYVANDYGRNNLYQFDKATGRFRDVAAEAGLED